MSTSSKILLIAFGLVGLSYFAYTNYKSKKNRSISTKNASDLTKTDSPSQNKEERVSITSASTSAAEKFYPMPQPQSKNYKTVRDVFYVAFKKEGFQLTDAAFHEGTIKETTVKSRAKNYTLTWLTKTGSCKIEAKATSDWKIFETKSYCF